MKLFVSVGTQLPFERLLNAVENIENIRIEKCIYQIAESNFKSSFGEVYDFLNPKDYDNYFNECDVFISHAGMGSIITAIDNDKPIIIMPRIFSYGEHRNDHQIATAEQYKSFKNVYCANNSKEIESILKVIVTSDKSISKSKLEVSSELLLFYQRLLMINVLLITTTIYSSETYFNLNRLFNSIKFSNDIYVKHIVLIQGVRELPIFNAPNFVKFKTISEKISLSKARNIMLEEVIEKDIETYDLVAFPDDDCLVPE